MCKEHKFEFDSPDEMIGVYWACNETQAIHKCKEDIRSSGFKPDTKGLDLLLMVAVKVSS